MSYYIFEQCFHSIWVDFVTFVLADFLDPGQRVDLHEGVGNTDDMHHIHHTLTDREKNEVKIGLTCLKDRNIDRQKVDIFYLTLYLTPNFGI